MALELLARLAQRRADQERLVHQALDGRWQALADTALEVAVETGDPVGLVLARTVGSWSAELVERILLRCDGEGFRDSVPLRELAVALARRHLAEQQERWREPDEAQRLELARLAGNLSRWLHLDNRLDEALDFRRAGVAWYRECSGADPLDLADQLVGLANILSDLGRFDAALEAALEARRSYDDAAAGSGGSDLSLRAAQALHLENLGVLLLELGRTEEAVQTVQQAVRSWRLLMHDDPGQARAGDVARALSHLSATLHEAGRIPEALAAARESIARSRDLAEGRADVYLPDLAERLNNLAICWADLGRRDEALAVLVESVTMLRIQVHRRPETFLPALATSLHNLGTTLLGTERREEAGAALREAVEVRERLFLRAPDPYARDLAASLHSFAQLLAGLGRGLEAAQAGQRAWALYRDLYERQPDGSLADLVMSAGALAQRLHETGDHAAAIRVAQESVQLSRRLIARQNAGDLESVAVSHFALGAALAGGGRLDESVAPTREAVDLFRELATRRPERFRPELAAALETAGERLAELARRDGSEDLLTAAHDHYAEAVETYAQLMKRRPEAYLERLADASGTLGLLAVDLGDFAGALPHFRRSAGLYRRMARRRQDDATLADLAGALLNQGSAERDLGRWRAALRTTRQAVALYRRLVGRSPDAYLPDLAMACNNLGNSLAEVGRIRYARSVQEEAVRLLAAPFHANPEAHGTRMQLCVENYLQSVAAADQEPDRDLLKPIVALLDAELDAEDEGTAPPADT